MGRHPFACKEEWPKWNKSNKLLQEVIYHHHCAACYWDYLKRADANRTLAECVFCPLRFGGLFAGINCSSSNSLYKALMYANVEIRKVGDDQHRKYKELCTKMADAWPDKPC